jgi:hypothetical protein
METVIILSVVGILLVGCWHAGTVLQKHWKQLETDPESVVLIERKWDWAIWGPFLIAIVVIAWVAPILIGYVVAAYLFDRAVDWIWFRYVDWCIAGANRENREQRTDDQGRSAAKGPAQRRHSLPRTGRAMGFIPRKSDPVGSNSAGEEI